MPDIVINGVIVKFPFEPYPIQLDYMKSVIECLDAGKNGILESPTGTGKTLCLLCAALAWFEHKMVKMAQQTNDDDETRKSAKEVKLPKLIYASRTHAQLVQVMKELKRTAYTFRASIIGSRDQLCIHPELREIVNAEKPFKCKDFRAKNKCEFHKDMKSKLLAPELRREVLDIEDLVRAGKKRMCCPYYAAREISKGAQLVFMPYNYLIDPKLRDMLPDMKDSIVILDEAHNIQNVCENAASASIKSTDIMAAARDMKYIVKEFDAATFQNNDLNAEEVYSLKASFEKLIQVISGMKLQYKNGKQYTTRFGGFIFTLLKKANITASNISLIEKLIDLLFENKQKKAPKGAGLKTILNFLRVAFSASASHLNNRIGSCYRIYIEKEVEPKCTMQKRQPKFIRDFDQTNKVVHFWCFSPAFGIQNVVGHGIRSMILTSGTLSPFQPLIKEMDIEIPIQLKNSHVIKPHQLYAKICKVGVNGVPLDGRWKNRDNKSYMMSLGESIVEVAKVVPGGLLIFFKSYNIMQKHHHFWQSNSIWKKMCEQKPIYIEPENKKELKPTIAAYNASVNQGNGAVFMAVLRGKISEGLDFIDAYGRAVIIVGVPYGPFTDPKVMLKKDCLNRNRTHENQLPSGHEWYCLEASRAFNQAIGRVIRHKNDYGAILLFDEGFSEDNIKRYIPKWINDHLSNKDREKFSQTINNLEKFFKRAEQTLPKPKPLEEPQVDLIDYDEPDTPNFQQSTEFMDASEVDDDDDDWLSDDSDDDESWHNALATLDMPQVTLHERKRKTSTSNSAEASNDAEMSEQQPMVCAHFDESKRKKMNGTCNLDVNMNFSDGDVSKNMESNMPPFVNDELDSVKFNQNL